MRLSIAAGFKNNIYNAALHCIAANTPWRMQDWLSAWRTCPSSPQLTNYPTFIYLYPMKKCLPHFLFCFCLISIFSACGSKYDKATDPLDAAREFINACLTGDVEKATYYMIDDAENKSQLLKIKRDFDAKANTEKYEFAHASIIINEDATLSDTVHIINYKNSYDNIGRKVKVIKRNEIWQVDFKYTFNGNL